MRDSDLISLLSFISVRILAVGVNRIKAVNSNVNLTMYSFHFSLPLSLFLPLYLAVFFSCNLCTELVLVC